ncbi:MAG: hypothetical protein HY841_00400 [Bacteroidetes bacterium]|nr:hypothetical protein [Bacteroidota bacterium]
MKKFFLIIIVTLSGIETSFSQIKIINTTCQKTFGGMGGIFKQYVIEFKNKTNAKVEVDSVKSIADTVKINCSFNKTENESYKISFGQSLKSQEKCKTCPDVSPKQSDLTKGVIVYYRRGEKKSSFKMTKFKQLPDIYAP